MKQAQRRMLALWICLAAWWVPLQAMDGLSMDERFQQARELAFTGEREEARQLCQGILEQHPHAAEVKTLLGRTHAWDKEYDEARRILREVVDERPGDVDARCALIDVELWTDHPQAALELAEEGLVAHPGNGRLYYRKARALDSQEMLLEALAAAESSVNADGEDRVAVKYYRRLLEQTQQNRISAAVGWEWFDDSTDPWYAASVGYRRFMPWGSLLSRANLARRFLKNGGQVEVDAYPDLFRNTYAYLNIGLSTGDLFPKLRYGGEIYHNFSRGWEASAGFRRLEFDSSGVTIWTASAAKYLGRYWIELRPQYVTKTSGRSLSARLRVRYFFNGRREYLEFYGGGGAGSDNSLIAEPEDLFQRNLGAEYRRRIRHSWILRGAIGLRTEDLTVSRNRDSVVLMVGFDHLF